MEDKNESVFKSIFKSTLIFGSTQVFQMIIMLIRTKVSAMYLGPLGMGIVSVYQTTILTVSQISSVGTPQSGVKEISNADEINRDEVIFVFSRLLNVLSLGGIFLMIILSNALSSFSFGNRTHIYPFMMLSLAVGLHVLSQKQLAIMQATRQSRKIAITSLSSAFASLCFGVVGYKFYGIDAIVPVLIGSYAAQFVTGKILLRNLGTSRNIAFRDVFKKSESTLKLGVLLMTSLILINVFNLIFNAFISKYGGLEDLGFYNAAFAITNGNVLVLLSVLTSDYFPRLSAVSNDLIKTNQIFNQQTELIVLLTAPMVIFLIVAAPIVVKLLLSAKFFVIIPILQLMSLGLIFRVIWQAMSYLILAQGDKKSYFVYDALIGNGSVLLINILFYFKFGLFGLGVSFIVTSVLVSIILYFVVHRKFKVGFNKKSLQSVIISISLAGVAYVFYTFVNNPLIPYLFLIFSIGYTFYIISKRGEFKLMSKLKKIKSK